MCNALMSLENGIICAALKQDKLNIIHSGHLFNSEKKLTLFDLYDVNYDIKYNAPKNSNLLPFDLFNTAIYNNLEPTEEFLNGRTKVINLKSIDSFSTKDFMQTLPFTRFGFNLYSEKEVVDLLKLNLFKIESITKLDEDTISKTGESVSRKSIIITCYKE